MKLTLIAAAFSLTLTGAVMAHEGHGHDVDHDHGHGHHHHRTVVCRAKNLRGHVYEAEGPSFRRERVQQRAMEKCQAHSAVCIAKGCSRH